MKKKCFKCSVIKPLEDFYKHKGMSDGHLNKCKMCTKKDVDLREKYLRENDQDWVEKERERSREKYIRLSYKDKQKNEWNRNKPSMLLSQYKNIRRKLKISKDKSVHHWSYSDEFVEDVIILSKEDHRYIHRFLKYDKINYMFRDEDGVLLDSKLKHEEYINKLLSEKLLR